MKTIDGIKYHITDSGILVPALMLREAKAKVKTPRDILPMLADEANAEQERVIVFTLNGQYRVIRKHLVTIGLVNETKIHPREVFRAAVQENAVAILMAHNHPSGDTEPSDSDLIATRRIHEAGKTLGINLLDHVIVAPPDRFKSIRESHPAYFN